MRHPLIPRFLFICLTVAAWPLALSGTTRLLEEPVPELRLNSGRILHDAQVRSFAEHVVMVRHRDGAETVAYEEFPAEYQTVLASRRPHPRADWESATARHAGPPSGPIRRPIQAAPSSPNGLVLLSTQPGRGLAKVTIQNPTSQARAARATELLARSVTGEIASGRNWVGLDHAGNIAVVLRYEQFIPAGESVELVVSFQQFQDDQRIGSVDWR